MNYSGLKKYNFSEIKTAGPRYTPGEEDGAPNLYIEELESTLDALSFSKKFRGQVEAFIKNLAKGIDDSSNVLDRVFKRNKRTPYYLKTLLVKLSNSSPCEARALIPEIKVVIKAVTRSINNREMKIYETKRNKEEKAEETGDDHELYQLRRFGEVLSQLRGYFSSHSSDAILNNCFLVLGAWGTGKTHFLCDYVKRLSEQNHLCIFSIAQNYPLSSDPMASIVDKSNIFESFSHLIAEFEKEGRKTKSRSLIIVDGINEGDRDEWKKSVISLQEIVKDKDYVGLVLSCRTPFQNIIFNNRALSQYRQIYHPGFNEIEFEAQEEFFKYYKIPFPEVPLLSEEFSRPLTLKLICETLRNLTLEEKKKGFSGIASGQKGMTKVLEDYIQKQGIPIEKKFRLPQGRFSWQLLKGTRNTKNGDEDGIAVRLADQQKEVLSYDEAIDVILNVTFWTSQDKAKELLKALIHNGILFEHYIYTEDGYIDAIRLPYQKFSDHIIARHLLKKYLDKSSLEAVKKCFYQNKPLGKVFKLSEFGHEYEMANWAEALMIEFPESIKRLTEENRELIFYLPQNKRLIAPALNPFLNSLFWRSPNSFCSGTDLIISQLLDMDSHSYEVLDTLLALSVKKNHPYKADRLSKFLFKQAMVERDLLWSEYLRRSYSSSTSYKIISWALTASKQGVQKATAKNCITVLMWMLTNVRKPQRDRATEALVRLGMLYPDLIFNRTLYSLGINDPYVSERMLSASYGVAMNKWAEGKLSFSKPFIIFVKSLVEEMFLPGAKFSTHNSVARDSALSCIEIARKINPSCIANRYIKYLKPPFQHIKSPFKSPEKITDKAVECVKPAIHMDFGNYTVGRLIPGRGNYQYDHEEYQKVIKQLQGRMFDLGYRFKIFEEIDREIPRMQNISRSDDGEKTDRYGKKYSWIAYYEMYGYREANGLLDNDISDVRISEVTFDPSLPEPPLEWFPKLPYLFRRKFKGFGDWMENGLTPQYENLLKLDRIRGQEGPWILLDGFIQQANPHDAREIFSFLRGLFVEHSNVELVRKKFASIEYPGNSAIPDSYTDYCTFAGEIPWSSKHAPYLRTSRGKPKRHKEEVFSSSTFVPFENKGKTIVTKEEDNIIRFVVPQGRLIKTPGVSVEIPVYTYGWEGYRSTINDYSGFMVPAPAVSSYLGLNFKNHSAELYDSRGKQATAYLRIQIEGQVHSSKLIYLRQDLLEKYLAYTEQTLVWAIWGERDVHYSVYQQRNVEAETRNIYRDYKHIHKTFYSYEDSV